MDEFSSFWATYGDITKRVKKKYIFKKTPFLEAKEAYVSLFQDSKRMLPVYQAQCAMALARCEDGMLRDEELESNSLESILHDKERARWRTEFARLFFECYEPTVVLLHASHCASYPPLSSEGFSPVNLSFSPFPPIPIHQFLPISQMPTAIQSYLTAIRIYEGNRKSNIAAALLYELALQLQKTGALGGAAICWEQVAQLVLYQKVALPSSALNPNKPTTMVKKNVKRKISSRAPITAYNALVRALGANLHCGQYKKATKNAFHIVELLTEEKSTLPGGHEKWTESLITLVLLYLLKRDFPKSHRTLQQISSGNEDSWQISLGFSCDLPIFLYDLIVASEEGETECVEAVVFELFSLLTSIQQEILLLLLHQSDK